MVEKNNLLFKVICLAVVIFMLSIFQWRRLTSNAKADNPHYAHYYITLNSILANYKLLAADKANVHFIKNKIYQFENDIRHTPAMPLVDDYRANYKNTIRALGFKSITNAHRTRDILKIAKQVFSIIDQYYLDNRIHYLTPLYWWGEGYSRRVLMFNLGSLFNAIPNRHMRIMGAYLNDSQLGAYSGFFVNNQTITLTPQFITGMPMLTALYLMPKHNYGVVGSYDALVPWGYFNVARLMDPTIRKVLDIAGIDVFSVLKTDLKTNQITQLTNTTLIPHNTLSMFASDYQPFLNNQSYGMAYLANEITYQDPLLIAPHESAIKHYFSNGGNRETSIFEKELTTLYGMLMQLKHKHDIILETATTKNAIKADAPAGEVDIKGIVGSRAYLTSNCQRENCTLVLNISKAPGWQAYVNHQFRQILRANFAFMAVTVPKGISHAWFIYEPFVDLICFFISIITLTILFVKARYGYK